MQTVLVFKFVFPLTSSKKSRPILLYNPKDCRLVSLSLQFFETPLIDRVTDQQ